MPFLRYGNRFRAQRRLMQQHFNSQAVSSFLPLQYAQINAFLKNILVSPEDYIDHAIRFAQLFNAVRLLNLFCFLFDTETI